MELYFNYIQYLDDKYPPDEESYSEETDEQEFFIDDELPF